MLKVNNLSKKYKKFRAVKNITFEVNPGEVVALLGPNGAGKSTTIKSIAGLLRKSEGTIKLKNFDHLHQEAKKRIAYIPEVPELYDLLTAWEHMKFIAKAYRITDWENKAENLFERYELTEKKGKLAKELSKGMRQKVSICCGLLSEPYLLLFDEPMIGLDPKAIKETKMIFRELASQGKIVFISTHLLDSIENVCDRILVMKNGKIIVRGTIDEIKSMYSDNQSLEEIFLEVTQDA